MTISREDKAKLSQRKVVEHNDLITSVAKMDKVPMKMFELAVSHFNKNARFKQSIERMQQQAYFEIREVKSKKGYKYRRIVPIPYVEWNDYDDRVTVRFDEAIMPYVMDLKKNFTQYALTDLMEMSSKYSIVLYRWLNMNYNQYEYYAKNGDRTKKQLNELKNPTISMDELRRLTDTQEEYPRMSSFTKYVLKRPCEEISEHTHLKVEFEKLKRGRVVAGIRFKLTGKRVERLPLKAEESSVKEEKERSVADSALYAKAMKSEYTQNLIKAGLLNVYQLTEQDLMIRLQKLVYPQYDELLKLAGGGMKGKKAVEKHINYVGERYHPASDHGKRNVVSYLDIAVSRYIVMYKSRGN